MGAQAAQQRLTGAIPGLAMHRTSRHPSTQSSPSRDPQRAFEMLRETMRRIEAFYTSGALEWIRSHRAELVAEMKRIEAQFDASISDGDLQATRGHLEAYVELNQQACAAFSSCGASDAQGALFHG